jgi:hypothetical protein
VRLLALCTLALLVIAAIGCDEPEESLSGEEEATESAKSSPSVTLEATSTATPTAVPTATVSTGWKTYTDPNLGFTLEYPPDLISSDLTGPTPSSGVRVIDFRHPTDAGRGFAVEVYPPSSEALTEWAQTRTACLPETIESASLDGKSAVFCTEQATENTNGFVTFDDKGRRFEISWLLPADEANAILASMQ